MKPILTLLIPALSLYSNLSAQPADTLHKEKKYYHFINFEFGKANNSWIYLQGGYAIQKQHAYLKLKVDGTEEPRGFILDFGDEPKESTSAFNVLIGKSYMVGAYNTFQFGAGLSYVEDISRGAFIRNTCTSYFCLLDHDIYETIKRKNIGLPIEVRYNLIFTKDIGLSFSANANLNSLKSYTGFSAGIVVGRLRDKIKK
ncbi:MAG: hypothetical protein WKF68_13500 [Daejeonella sp.]